MANRTAIPKQIHDEVLREFNHLCAICGEVKPQIHHIDEDHDNHAIENLLPLCPNCHLHDHHSPTTPVDPRKVAIFRQYKDPLILTSQFEPIFARFRFLLEIDEATFDAAETNGKATELYNFVQVLEMGAFYAPKIKRLLRNRQPARISIGPANEQREQMESMRERADYLKQLAKNKAEAISLLVELLRYQKWTIGSSHLKR
jgi:hypothetical protein